MSDPQTLPCVPAAQLPDGDPQRRWLVDTLWARAGVGLIAGSPKLGKSWLGLDLAVSVASGTPCLDVFDVPEPGPALLYMAEDAAPDVKARLRGLCRHRHLDLNNLPVYLITVPALRLDLDDDQQRLFHTVAQRRPRLLLLDPFVRLHKINENDAGEVSAILAYLRQLQRTFDLAVVVVHHTRKNGRPGGAGQNLRGSSDFHAWADSSLYLQRHKDTVILTPEHRAAPAPAGVNLRLHATPHHHDTHFEVVDLPPPTDGPSADLDTDLLAALADGPRTRDHLRLSLRVRNQRLTAALDRLAKAGRIIRQDGAWAVPIPPPTPPPERNAPHAQQLSLIANLPAAPPPTSTSKRGTSRRG